MNRMSSGVFAAWVALWLAVAPAALAASHTVAVQADKPGAQISSTMFGIFFEDINFAADGGIYAELVKNRSFEFPEPLMGWSTFPSSGAHGKTEVLERDTQGAANLHFLRLTSDSPAGFGVSNEGFRGIGVRQGALYDFTVYARAAGTAPATLRIELVGANGQTLGRAALRGFNQEWKKRAATLRATATDAKAHLNVSLEGRGALDLDMVSLFPRDTWRGRPGGLRADLVKLLKDLNPGFLRFPGGCIVEGRDLNNRYQWKTTIGDPAERRLIMNRWNVEFKHRPTPDYFQSFGLGFYEYFQLSEDIGAEPLPILNCGMACQYNTGELAPLEEIDPYIKDALDLIEFANGPVTSTWGRRRAAMGHPRPFGLKLLGVGNEQWGPQYFERYKLFAKVLKEKHPEVTLVSAAGPAPDGQWFRLAWKELPPLGAEILDEHYYQKPDWFEKHVARYDAYDRAGPKVFAGEYAAQSVGIARPNNRNDWECALAEGAFMTGLERNAEVVRMTSYAPLFAHVDAWQWTPNLIWFDNLRSFGTPSYYVQKLFGTNRGTAVLPVTLDGSEQNGQSSLYASASLDARTGEVILKLVNAAPEESQARIRLNGLRPGRRSVRALVLASADLKAENSLAEPTKLSPAEARLEVSSNELVYKLAPNSLNVLRIPR
ncbi:MAG: alpha-L-arabinofuranosidase C-terminal domain-containing protein [Pyrinomonadaceae bacterium]